MDVYGILDPIDLEQAIEAGYVREQTDGYGYRILNYTETAVYTRTWTPATLTCRGLIVDTDDNVIARPWRKFFNYGEHTADTLDLSAPVEVTDKADGSLGILYRSPTGEPRIATRGSFTSEQAVHATGVYQDRYWGEWTPDSGFTYLFEIVYPANRIVLDYGTLDDLILLGAVEIETGDLYGPNDAICSRWPGPRTPVFDYPTLADALSASPRLNAEGLVVRYLDGPMAGTMAKIKQADYVSLHRIITGLTARRIWERAAVWAIYGDADNTASTRQIAQHLRMDVVDVEGIIDAGPFWRDEIVKTAPEEFTGWIDRTLDTLTELAQEIVAIVEGEAFGHVGRERRDIARDIADHPYRGMVFAALDRKPYLAQAWAAVRPAAEKPFAARSEDVA